MTYSQVFDLVCPYYMLYGMTYDQFWYGDSWMAATFREYHILKRKQKNEELWVNGMYQLNALTVALNNAFSNKKIKYPEKPFDIFGKTELEKEQEKIQERQKLIDWLNRLRIKK